MGERFETYLKRCAIFGNVCIRNCSRSAYS